MALADFLFVSPPTGAASAAAREADRHGFPAHLRAPAVGNDAQQWLCDELAHLRVLVPGCDDASVAATVDGVWEHTAASDDTARSGDTLQHLLGDGPSLHAWRTGHSVFSHDLRSETRWPRWCDRATAELGLGAALAIQLTSPDGLVATLNLYSRTPAAMTGADITSLHAMTVPLTTILVEAQRHRQQRRTSFSENHPSPTTAPGSTARR